jgi:hypothetical protein
MFVVIALLSATAILGAAAAVATFQERVRRRRLVPADPVKVSRFLASRRAAA